jgi:hypothetical protein
LSLRLRAGDAGAGQSQSAHGRADSEDQVSH